MHAPERHQPAQNAEAGERKGRPRPHRFAGPMLAGAMSLAAIGPALAGTSLLGDGITNWFYACSAGRMMNLAIRHADGTMTRFSLGPGDSTQGPVRRGDVVAWRCGGQVDPAARFIYIVTLQ